MSVLPYAFLMLFWAGVGLAFFRAETAGFGKRIRALAGKGRDAAKNSRPAVLWRGFILSKRKNRMKDELSEALAYTRNIAILGSGGHVSAAVLFPALAEQSGLLKPAFLEMARCLDLNDRKGASGALYAALSEPCAKDIGAFLASWEDMEPEGLLQSIEVYRSMLLEERTTRIRRRDELVSDLVYLPVVLNCIVVLLNFLYVAYFLEQKELLSLFF